MTTRPVRPNNGFKVRALGEIAIRCADLEAMEDFYHRIIGLEYLEGGHRDGIIFFKISDGFEGHTSVLALFRNDAGRDDLHPRSANAPETGGNSSLHHIALSLPFAEQDAAMQWYEENGLKFNVQEFGWIGWRGVFTTDPEGNTVELVAYDRSMHDEP